jgi:hypothetical protein
MANNQYTFSSAKEHLLSHVEMITESGCWIWMGSLAQGYGRIMIGGKGRGAHVVAYELFVGSVPDGLELDHLCRVRCCCNPWHLEPVTHLENVRRGIAGWNFAREMCPRGHAYEGSNIMIVRRKGVIVGKFCRACKKVQSREGKRRQREDPEKRQLMVDRVREYRHRLKAQTPSAS